MKRRWPCFLVLLLALASFVVPDPLPFVDEVVLTGLAALCFGRKAKGEG